MGRSEWRFYHDAAFPRAAQEGDWLLAVWMPDGRIQAAVLAEGSLWADAGKALIKGRNTLGAGRLLEALNCSAQ